MNTSVPEFVSCQPLDAAQQRLHIHWVDSLEACNTAIEALRGAKMIGLDTEFVRRKTYFAQAGLIQVAMQNHDHIAVFLFDCTAAFSDQGLREIWENPDCLKVLHSVGEDLEVLRERFGVVPAPIFDTQVAAGLASVGNMMSLSKLVEHQLGLTLDKGETTSDWLHRPLRAEQINYAAIDVQVLLPLHQRLSQRLIEQNRLAWVMEDCLRVAQKALQSNEAQPHHKVFSAQRFTREQQIKLWRLLRWRQQRALQRDLPKTWILENGTVIEIAKQLFATARALQNFFEQQAPKFIRRAEEIWPILEKPISDQSDPEFESYPILSKEQTQRFQQLRAMADLHAQHLGIDAQLFANRKMLEQLILQPGLASEWLGWRGLEWSLGSSLDPSEECVSK